MSNNKQQTAVEWFFEQLTEVDYNCINKTFLQNDNSLAGYRLRGLLEQAKEMEKERIIDAHYEGQCNQTEGYPLQIAEQYYNETFRGGEQ